METVDRKDLAVTAGRNLTYTLHRRGCRHVTSRNDVSYLLRDTIGDLAEFVRRHGACKVCKPLAGAR